MPVLKRQIILNTLIFDYRREFSRFHIFFYEMINGLLKNQVAREAGMGFSVPQIFRGKRKIENGISRKTESFAHPWREELLLQEEEAHKYLCGSLTKCNVAQFERTRPQLSHRMSIDLYFGQIC